MTLKKLKTSLPLFPAFSKELLGSDEASPASTHSVMHFEAVKSIHIFNHQWNSSFVVFSPKLLFIIYIVHGSRKAMSLDRGTYFLPVDELNVATMLS